jgi:hypothetical protein
MKRTIALGLATMVFLAGCSKPANTGAEKPGGPEGGPLGASYEGFRSAFASKDFSLALTELRSLVEAFWAEAPLGLGNIRFVNGPDNSYGIYEPRPIDVFTAGEPIYLYMEPSGYAITTNPAGYHEFGFKADFQVADGSGQVLGGQKDFANLAFKSWNKNTEISLTFTYTLSGLEKGRYKLITEVADARSAKQVTAEKTFVIQ